jgi:hypothetical protein
LKARADEPSVHPLHEVPQVGTRAIHADAAVPDEGHSDMEPHAVEPIHDRLYKPALVNGVWFKSKAGRPDRLYHHPGSSRHNACIMTSEAPPWRRGRRHWRAEVDPDIPRSVALLSSRVVEFLVGLAPFLGVVLGLLGCNGFDDLVIPHAHIYAREHRLDLMDAFPVAAVGRICAR